MGPWVGLGGATRNACVALCTGDEILGICEQERITRVRAAGFNPTGLPDEALDELLRRAGRQRGDVTGYALTESMPALPRGVEIVRLDTHFAHACSAFLTSPFDTATIVVCDHKSPQITVWDGAGADVTRVEWPWYGIGFADVYSQCAEALGFAARGHEQRMEAMARLDPARHDDRATRLCSLADDRLQFAPDWRARIESWIAGGGSLERAAVAAALQSRVGDLLIEFLEHVKRRAPLRRRLCVGGRLFNNSHFNSLVKLSGVFDEVFVPVNPDEAGLAVGAALHVSGHGRRPVTPFLGPSYSPQETKATLDNCKLTYQWASETDTIAIVVEALLKGRLVAWFDGAMEWGPRALGARSILASPFAPYALDNLNQFLKHRESWRGYALSGLDTAIHEHFDGPESAPFMECDYIPRERERFRHILPGPKAAARVQTVGSSAPPRFQALLQAFGQAAGIPVVVNTSFNGFQEPIVCGPRDAVRVFFGTGIDTLVLDEFVINK
jgi:carbamoyltransferase